MDPIGDNYDDPYANLYQTPKRPNTVSNNGTNEVSRPGKINNFNSQGENKKVFNPYGNQDENIKNENQFVNGENLGKIKNKNNKISTQLYMINFKLSR